MTSKKVANCFQKDFFEQQAWSHNQAIAGVDEVGRGCIMGPLVAACVVLPYHAPPFLKDSKRMSPKARQVAYEWIMIHAHSAYSIAHPRIIDKYNIYQTTLGGMRKVALQMLIHYPEVLNTFLVDAMPLNLELYNKNVYYFNKAEDHSSSVAAASIVAKVVRDQLMNRLSNSFVGYGLEHHKGYPTAFHAQSVRNKNIHFLYRKSFLVSWP